MNKDPNSKFMVEVQQICDEHGITLHGDFLHAELDGPEEALKECIKEIRELIEQWSQDIVFRAIERKKGRHS
jgi:hypothetical protein